MSSRASSRRPANKVNLKPATPRTLPEITDEYNQLLARAGGLQYQTFVYQDELTKVNARLVEINHEAAARQALDKEAPAAPVETTKEEA